jgi:hypothetical protein
MTPHAFRGLHPGLAPALLGAVLLTSTPLRAQTAPTAQPASPAAAPVQGAKPLRIQLTPAQEKEFFAARKAQERRNHTARQTILRDGLRCIEAATDLKALGACSQQERAAYRALMVREREETLTLFKRLGVPLPEASSNRPDAPTGRSATP